MGGGGETGIPLPTKPAYLPSRAEAQTPGGPGTRHTLLPLFLYKGEYLIPEQAWPWHQLEHPLTGPFPNQVSRLVALFRGPGGSLQAHRTSPRPEGWRAPTALTLATLPPWDLSLKKQDKVIRNRAGLEGPCREAGFPLIIRAL